MYIVLCIGGRSDKSGYLEVDGTYEVKGSSPETMRHLTTDGTLFIGNRHYSVVAVVYMLLATVTHLSPVFR